MTRASKLMKAFLPWAGLVVGLIAASVVHQVGSAGSFNNCLGVSPGPLLAVAALGLIACAGSGLASWRGTRGSSVEVTRVIGAVSAGIAALFMFLILLAVIATLVLPPCFE